MFLWAVLVGNANDVEVLSLMCVAFFFNLLQRKTEIPGPTQSLSRIFFSLIKNPILFASYVISSVKLDKSVLLIDVFFMLF